MKRELYNKWLEALESGRYEQAHGALRVGNAYCALGLLCHVAGIDHKYNSEGDHVFGYKGCWSTTILPALFAREVGMSSQGRSTRNMLSITELNDRGKSFAVIAECLRLNPHQYITEIYDEA